MTLPDTDLERGLAIVRWVKGGKGRTVPFGPRTGARSTSTYGCGVPTGWPVRGAVAGANRGKEFAYHAMRQALSARAELAGLGGFHPHLLRHTMAARWLDAGGSEGGLMAVAGWSRRDMIDRYMRATSERRAADEARRLGLGDQF
jgi:integrase